MTILKKIACACAVAASLSAGSAAAAPIVLDFEGIAEFANVLNFYNGGADSTGASGTDYGVSFSSDSLVLIDSDAGGNGSIHNMPSGSAILTFFSGGNATMNVAGGFDTRLAFHYSALSAGFVNMYDGVNGTGNLLASLNLAINTASCADVNNLLCSFGQVEILFGGTARSVAFGGLDGDLVFDDIAIGAVDAGPGPTPVPEPATLALSALGLAGLAAARRKARKAR